MFLTPVAAFVMFTLAHVVSASPVILRSQTDDIYSSPTKIIAVRANTNVPLPAGSYVARDGWRGYSPQDWKDSQNANLYSTQPANIEPSTGSSLPTTVQSLSSSSLTATATPSLFTSSGPKLSQSRSFSVSIDASPPLSTTTPVKQSTGVVPLCSCSAVKGPGPVVPSGGYSM